MLDESMVKSASGSGCACMTFVAVQEPPPLTCITTRIFFIPYCEYLTKGFAWVDVCPSPKSQEYEVMAPLLCTWKLRKSFTQTTESDKMLQLCPDAKFARKSIVKKQRAARFFKRGIYIKTTITQKWLFPEQKKNRLFRGGSPINQTKFYVRT